MQGKKYILTYMRVWVYASGVASSKAPAGSIRLTINIPEDLHRDMKVLAAKQGRTLRAYIIEAFTRYLKGKV